jgi:hypothetical protein
VPASFSVQEAVNLVDNECTRETFRVLEGLDVNIKLHWIMAGVMMNE